MNKGYFISIEGPDGAGKSTQLKNIIKYFKEKDIDIIFTREPGGTEIGEKIRKIILDKENEKMCDMAEALLYAASRAQHVNEKIKPKLDEGRVVLCDRYVDSSIAYQGYGRELGELVTVINDYAIAGVKPDITILLLINPEEGRGRINNNEKDRLEIQKDDFHQRVYEGYRKLCEKEPSRFHVIDASKNIEAVKADIYSILDKIEL
ncbi:MAG TPA: dTMP kinase [Anaerovoracaceae bacterium]|nr:dTMP kinase [Anaerovoracaceae bacterium]